MSDEILKKPDLDYAEFHGMLTVAPQMREFSIFWIASPRPMHPY